MNPALLRLFLRRHLDTLLALTLATLAFCIYLWTLCPTVYWGDCAELVTAAVTLGIPHPTGYPLYCLLGKAWTLLLPVGSYVWRLNVLSAVFGSLAVACCYGFARAASLSRPLAVMAAGLLAFTSTFWQQCLVTETYSLAAFFTCLLLFLAARWQARGCQATDLRRLAVAYGFALTSHQTNTLFLPGFVAFVLWSAPALRQWQDKTVRREWAKTLGLGALPLLVYLYLPLRARMHPAYNWGDIETPFAFFYHVTGRVFAVDMFHDPLWKIKLRFLSWITTSIPSQFSWPLAALCVPGLGLFWQRREERPLAMLLTWIVLIDIVFTLNYNIYNGYIYFIPCYIVMSVCAGRTLTALWQTLELHIEPQKRRAYAAFGAACALSLIPVQIAGHARVSLRGNWTCYDYSRNLLASVPPHGILIENGDDTTSFGVAYQQIVEGRRPDIIPVDRGLLRSLYDTHYRTFAGAWYFEDLTRRYPRLCALYPPYGMSAAQSLMEDPLHRIIQDAVARHVPVCVLAPAGVYVSRAVPPVCEADGKCVRLDVYLERHYDTAVVGLLTQVYAKSRQPSDAALQAETERDWRLFSLRGVFSGDLQRDPYLKPLAVSYGNGSLARARLAYGRKDYRIAAASYTDVLSLFSCDEAAQGLLRCTETHHEARLTSAVRRTPIRSILGAAQIASERTPQ